VVYRRRCPDILTQMTRVLVVILLLASACIAQNLDDPKSGQTGGRLNGYGWMKLSEGERVAYVRGAADALILEAPRKKMDDASREAARRNTDDDFGRAIEKAEKLIRSLVGNEKADLVWKELAVASEEYQRLKSELLVAKIIPGKG
jgi:hypothetical protein